MSSGWNLGRRGGADEFGTRSQFELNLRTWWASLDEVQRTLVANPAISTLLYRSDAAIYDVRSLFLLRRPSTDPSWRGQDILEFLQSQILVNVPPQAFASLRGLADHVRPGHSRFGTVC